MSIDHEALIRENTLDNFATERIDTIANGLLGTYNDQGVYEISDAVKEELTKLTKYKKTTFNNSLFCVVNRPGIGELVFKIDYEKNTHDNIAKATMYVLENLYKVNGYLQNTIKTEIAEYVGQLDDFIEKSYKQFNINVKWDDDEGMEYKVNEDDPSLFSYISAQKQFASALDKLTTDKYNKIYEQFFTEKLRVLNSQGTDFSKAVLATFRAEYAKIEKFFLSVKDYKALSELLDVCVEKHKLSRAPQTAQEKAQVAQEQQYLTAITPAIQKFSESAEQIREDAVEKAKNRLSKDDKQRIEEMERGVQSKPTPTPQPKTPSKPSEIRTKVETPKVKTKEEKPFVLQQDFNQPTPPSGTSKPKEVKEPNNVLKDWLAHIQELNKPTSNPRPKTPATPKVNKEQVEKAERPTSENNMLNALNKNQDSRGIGLKEPNSLKSYEDGGMAPL